MATITLGNIKFNWKGAWNSATAYVVDDVVSLSGSSYVCIQAGTNQNPASATAYWEQMSSAGTNGTDLSTTLTTQGDIVYRDGSGLQRLAAGTSGQVLQTGGSGANPSWTTMSSDIVKVAEGTHTGSTTLIFDSLDTSTYQNFNLIMSDVVSEGGNNPYLKLRFRYDNSGTQTTDTATDCVHRQAGNYVYQTAGNSGESSGTSASDEIRLNWAMSHSSYSNHTQYINMMVYDMANTSSHKSISVQTGGMYYTTGNNEYGYYNNGFGTKRNASRAYNGLEISSNSDNFHAKYKLYGLK